MRVSEANRLLEKSIIEGYENWVNGNLTDTVIAIVKLPSSAAAIVSLEIAARLDKDSRAMFLRHMESEAISALFAE